MGKFFASPVKLPKTELPQYCVHPTTCASEYHISTSLLCKGVLKIKESISDKELMSLDSASWAILCYKI